MPIEGSEYVEVSELKEALLNSLVTLNKTTPTVSSATLTFDFGGKMECFATLSGGGGIVVNENITVAYSNAANFMVLWATVNVTTATRTVTFPTNHVSGDSRWTSATRLLTLPVGRYQLSVMYDGSYYHVTCSQIEV